MKFKIKLGILFAIGIVATIITFIVAGPQPGTPFDQLHPAKQIIFLFGGMSSVAIWLWMIADCFRKMQGSRGVIWGFIVLLGNWLGSIIYFIFVYVPRENKNN